MSLNCGIVGLPNVGKSTLFNAITNTTNAQSANYPFCTIEPNIGRVPVADERMEKIANIAKTQKIIPTFIEIVDIAGLVKGASKGEGLGNQFLGNIRSVDAILHVIRCFNDSEVTHVEGDTNPIRDLEIIETELLISDISLLIKKIDSLQKKIKNNKEASEEIEVCNSLLEKMNNGVYASDIIFDSEIKNNIKKSLQLITDKPIVYICNCDEDGLKNGSEYIKTLQNYLNQKKNECKIISICAKLEAELSTFSNEEKIAMLEEIGAKSTGLEQVAKCGFDVLNLITYFTAGEKEVHAWSIKKGFTAPQAAGVIHTDFEKGFIKAETISYADYIQFNGESGSKQNGKLRLEGKEYIVQDGDIMHFKFNV